MAKTSKGPKHFAVIGAGIAGIACARTLVQAGHSVTVFEKSPNLGGRMATRSTLFGSFDHGAQYFTVRDPRFSEALATVPGLCKRWSANAVRVLDAHGRVTEAPLPAREAHWVPVPGMSALVTQWAQPLLAATQVELKTRVTQIEVDALEPKSWQLRTEAGDARHVYGGFDGVMLALPAPQSVELLETSGLSPKGSSKLAGVDVAPCWTLMLAFPNAMQPGLGSLGPQWNAARSTHHRIAWLARESSKPGREPMERWTVQASAAWSREHLQDDPARVEAKMLKAFAEVTGIHATPAHTAVHRWRYAQTRKPLGQTHLWDTRSGIGACGDWCIGHRVEDAFVSGLELALAAG
jgi:renalase